MRTEYLLEREVELVLDLLTYENRLVMRTLLHTGLRIGDVLALKPEQLKPNFWITEQKTGKRRQVGIPEPLLTDLRESADAEWVFPGNVPGKHRTRQAVWKDVKRAADRLLQLGIHRLFISLGADGVYAAMDGNAVQLPNLPGRMVNTTGCGDAFMAAIVWAYLEGMDLKTTALAGLAAGSIAMESPETINPAMSAEALKSRMK